jgi:hypothetical protein
LRAGLSDTILKGTHPGTIPARFGLIWFCQMLGGVDRNISDCSMEDLTLFVPS